MPPSVAVVIRCYIYDLIHLTLGIYSVINVLRFFFEVQMSADKPTPLLAKKTSCHAVACNLLYT